jgi:Mor family transcriptional regulator
MHPRDREIIDRYRNGDSLAVLAKAYRLSTSGIAKVLARHNVKRRRKGPPLKLEGWSR